MMLSRFKSDCKYFLGYGNRYPGNLYFGNVDKHISAMRTLHAALPEAPEWLTLKDIDELESNMKFDTEKGV